MSDTPKTDAWLQSETGIDFHSRAAEFMRSLERQWIMHPDGTETRRLYKRIAELSNEVQRLNEYIENRLETPSMKAGLSGVWDDGINEE